MDRSRDNDPPIELEGRKVRLRDWHEEDLASLRSQLDPARPWHDTNGPYFGRMTPAEADAMAARLAALATKDPASLPQPRDSLAIAELTTDRLLGQASWYWECEQTDWGRLGLVIYDERFLGPRLRHRRPAPLDQLPIPRSPTPCAWTSPHTPETQP